MLEKLKKSEKTAERLKAFVWGNTGTGKTSFSLHFPSAILIDTEKGSTHYGNFFEFDRLETADPKEIDSTVDELIQNPSGFKTFILDSFTTVCANFVENGRHRLAMKCGNPNYELQPRDYNPIYRQIEKLLNKIIALDMNVIVTAREKVLYSKEDGEFMKPIGYTFDAYKSTPYLFDVNMRLILDPTGNRSAHVIRDRTNRLPENFKLDYGIFSKFIGIETLEREAVVFKQLANVDANVGRSIAISYKGSDIKTAGIDADQLAKLEKIVKQQSEEKVKQRLQDDYGITSFLDLKHDEATLFISDLTENK